MRKAIAAGLVTQKSPLLADTQRRTPVDTGELRGSESADSDDTSLTLRATAGHAIYVHQGARGRPARPYLRDAVETGLPGVIAAIITEADRTLA